MIDRQIEAWRRVVHTLEAAGHAAEAVGALAILMRLARRRHARSVQGAAWQTGAYVTIPLDFLAGLLAKLREAKHV